MTMKKIRILKRDLKAALKAQKEDTWRPHNCLIAQAGIRLGITKLEDSLDAESDIGALQSIFDTYSDEAKGFEQHRIGTYNPIMQEQAQLRLGLLEAALPMEVEVVKLPDAEYFDQERWGLFSAERDS